MNFWKSSRGEGGPLRSKKLYCKISFMLIEDVFDAKTPMCSLRMQWLTNSMNYSQSVEIRFGLPFQGRGVPLIQAAGPDGPFKAKYADRSDFVGREATQEASNKASSNQSNSQIMGTKLYIHLSPLCSVWKVLLSSQRWSLARPSRGILKWGRAD